MGYYLAIAVFEMHRIFNIENVVIFGGVTAGLSGGIMKEEAERIIKEKFPQLSHIKIHLTPEPSYGGAIGAGYLANLERRRRETSAKGL